MTHAVYAYSYITAGWCTILLFIYSLQIQLPCTFLSTSVSLVCQCLIVTLTHSITKPFAHTDTPHHKLCTLTTHKSLTVSHLHPCSHTPSPNPAKSHMRGGISLKMKDPLTVPVPSDQTFERKAGPGKHGWLHAPPKHHYKHVRLQVRMTHIWTQHLSLISLCPLLRLGSTCFAPVLALVQFPCRCRSYSREWMQPNETFLENGTTQPMNQFGKTHVQKSYLTQHTTVLLQIPPYHPQDRPILAQHPNIWAEMLMPNLWEWSINQPHPNRIQAPSTNPGTEDSETKEPMAPQQTHLANNIIRNTHRLQHTHHGNLVEI